MNHIRYNIYYESQSPICLLVRGVTSLKRVCLVFTLGQYSCTSLYPIDGSVFSMLIWRRFGQYLTIKLIHHATWRIFKIPHC